MLYDSEIINQGKYFFKTIKKWDVTEGLLTLRTADSSTPSVANPQAAPQVCHKC